jgi:hypothetical protein
MSASLSVEPNDGIPGRPMAAPPFLIRSKR